MTTRSHTDTVKVRPRMPDGSQFKGSFFVHVEHEVIGERVGKPIRIGFSCQGKHGNTDIGFTIAALNRRVRLRDGVVKLARNQSRKKMLPDRHPVVMHLLKMARAVVAKEIQNEEGA